ncbi:MAG: hypothetical protein JAY74_13350 [Candidatus Thiodiazotropha taylori]|nr:hypothetical protein [Candidatus Thiodiazotropha taylori]
MAATGEKQPSLNIGFKSEAANMRSETSEVAITLEVQNKLLRHLYTSKSNGQSVTELFNKELKHIQLISSDRLESRFKIEGARVVSEYRKMKSGHKRTKFDKKSKKISILNNELRVTDDICSAAASDAHIDHKNTGPRIDNSSKSVKTKVIRTLEGNVKHSLDFVETYGALPKALVCETFNGETCTLCLDGCAKAGRNPNFEELQSPEKTKVRDILQVCDLNMISDSAYHELSMQIPSMPRKHLLVSCRNDLNSNFDIKRTPGMLPGSYLSLKVELEKDLTNSEAPLPDLLKIKISGDGAKVSKISNFIIISYSYIDNIDTLSHLNQRVLAVVKCEENYENLEKSCQPIFEEINKLAKEGISIENKAVKIEFFVGGDMKFLQLLLGLNSSIAEYACPWCVVSKHDRGNITFPMDHYHKAEFRRTTAGLKTASSSASKYGSKNPPLVDIEVDHFVADELHLMMRISEVLLRNLIDDALSKDNLAKVLGNPTDNVTLLVNAIQSCGVSFRTWKSKSGELEWSSLSGNDLKKLLKNLPDKLIFCLNNDTSDDVRHLWKDFSILYNKISNKVLADTPEEIFELVKKFIRSFISIGQKGREGYLPVNVTPYMHCLTYHVPYFVKMYGSLFKFSGQGVEKTNDIIKQIHQAKSNKHDPTTDALLVRKRLEYGQTCVREKRKYEKADLEYWSVRKSQAIQIKKQKIQTEQLQADEQFKKVAVVPIDELSVSDLKVMLKDAGVSTRCRKRERLIEQLKIHKII